MRAVALHADVLVATSAALRVNCVLVRGSGGGSEVEILAGAEQSGGSRRARGGQRGAVETFAIARAHSDSCMRRMSPA